MLYLKPTPWSPVPTHHSSQLFLHSTAHIPLLLALPTVTGLFQAMTVSCLAYSKVPYLNSWLSGLLLCTLFTRLHLFPVSLFSQKSLMASIDRQMEPEVPGPALNFHVLTPTSTTTSPCFDAPVTQSPHDSLALDMFLPPGLYPYFPIYLACSSVFHC